MTLPHGVTSGSTSGSANDATHPSQDQPDQHGTHWQERARTQGIFLHTGWRSAGTWVWSRLRAVPSVQAFYEPLSTVLGDLKLADIPAIEPARTSGHPPLKAPYYEEYRSFIRENARGVIGYRKYFSTDRFGSTPDADFPALQAYLKSLCDGAAGQGKVPVFKFCRSQGRMPWLRSAFPDAMHVAVVRNPASQFASGWLLNQEWHNPFFVAAPFRVLGLNQTEPVVQRVIEACEVRLPPDPPVSMEQYAAVCEQYARTAEGTNAYRAFVALWILAVSRMRDDQDLVLDIDEVGQSPSYAADLRAQFIAQADVAPDFSGARNLVDETRQSATRMVGVDGGAIRAIHSAAMKFLVSEGGPDKAQAKVLELAREKLALAGELSQRWR